MSDLGKRLRLSIFWVVSLLAAGTLGFMWTGERDAFHAFYLTVVILTSVGMEGAHTDGERAVALFLMLIGIGLVLYATGTLIAFIVEGHVKNLLGQRQMHMQIEKMKKHTIVVGFGRMGRALCELLHEHRIPFVLVERDDALITKAEAAHYKYVKGDAITEDVLREAGIDRASGLIVCLPRESDVVFVTLKARSLNKDVQIIARGQFAENEPLLRHAGANRVIVPTVLGASQVLHMLLKPALAGMTDLEVTGHNLEVTTLELADLPGAIGKRIGDLDLSSSASLTAAAIVHDDGTRLLRPPGDYQLIEGDQVIVLGESGEADRLVRLFGREAQDAGQRQADAVETEAAR